MAGSDDRRIEPHKDMYITKVSTSAGKDKFLEYVLTQYEDMHTQDITPMFVYKSLNTGETGIVLDAKDGQVLSKFVKNKIRSRPEVTSVKVDHMVSPVFFPRPDNIGDLKRFAVTVTCEPIMCKGIYKQFVDMGNIENVTITMVTYVMNDNGQHVTMSIITPDLATLNALIEDHITPIQGVSRISVSELAHVRKLSTKFEWKRTVQPIAQWEAMIGRDYEERVYRDVDQGC